MPDLNIKAWKGLRNTVSPERMEPGDMVSATNVLLDDDGRLTRRMGMMQQQATLSGARMHSLWTDGDMLGFCVRGRVLCKVDPTTLALIPLAALRADGPMAYAAQSGLVYYTNGTDKGVVQGLQVRSWGIEAPVLPLAYLTPGSMPAGMYQYTMTFIREDGQESGSGAVGVVNTTAPGGLFWNALPVSTDATVTHKAIYVSSTDGEILYRAVLLENSATVANYNADTTELTYPLDTQFMSPPPAGQVLAFFKGRLWVARDADVFPSQPFSPELFDLREFLPAQGIVTMLAPRPDDVAMLVGSTAGMGWVTGDDVGDMSYQHALDDPVLPGSLVWVPGADYGDGSAGQTAVPMWAGQSGIYAAAPPYWTVTPVTLDRVKQTLQGRMAAVFDRARNLYLATIAN